MGNFRSFVASGHITEQCSNHMVFVCYSFIASRLHTCNSIHTLAKGYARDYIGFVSCHAIKFEVASGP
jgi:hypothetical protein